MCDTFVAMRESTRDGSILFGKNSDREPNEAHEVIMLPAADYPAGDSLKCTYISIPQVRHTHAVLLCKPFWIWGAEMGANEHGVVIGNEAVFTRVPQEKQAALIGMDLLRLGLERGASAEEALHIVTGLLEQYGQAGNCGFTHPFTYHNSFIITDRREAWVLETAGKQWAAERVRGVRSISNSLSIGADWDLASNDLVQVAVDRGWCKNRSDFHFARCYSDFLYTTMSASAYRRSCTLTGLQKFAPGVEVADAMRLLRDHGDQTGGRIDLSVVGAQVCMHAGFGPVRINQTTGSLVAHLKDGRDTFWVTGTSAPCTGVFKPVWFESGIPWSAEPQPQGTYDPACLWWRHEAVHRAILENYPQRIADLAGERDALEREFLAQAATAIRPEQCREVARRCYSRADEAETAWGHRLKQPGSPARMSLYYRHAWGEFNKQAKIYG